MASDEPAVQGEADLGDLAVAQDHALRGETLREGRRAGFGLEPGEVARSASSVTRSSRRPPSRPTTRWTGSASRTSFATTAPDADRRSSSSPSSARVPASPSAARRSRSVSRRAGSTSTGRYRMASSRGEPRSRSPPEQPRRQRARAGTGFRDGERGGAAQRVPRLLEQPADRRPEDRVGLGGREEVGARRPGSRLRAPVVAVAGLVERALHEPGEGDGSVPRDLLADRIRRARPSSPTDSGSGSASRRKPGSIVMTWRPR